MPLEHVSPPRANSEFGKCPGTIFRAEKYEKGFERLQGQLKIQVISLI